MMSYVCIFLKDYFPIRNMIQNSDIHLKRRNNVRIINYPDRCFSELVPLNIKEKQIGNTISSYIFPGSL